MDQNPENLAQRLLLLTRAMHQDALDGHWSAVAQKEQERLALAEALHARAWPQAVQAKVATLLEETLAWNRRIIERAGSDRDETRQSLDVLRQGRKADRAYRHVEAE